MTPDTDSPDNDAPDAADHDSAYPYSSHNRKNKKNNMRLGPAQDVTFFFMRYHLSALQRCAFIFSIKF